MKKTLYSLMLSDDVVREVDLLAHQQGTNRSSLINQILAEYVSVVTPEQRINDIFGYIEALLSPSRELVPFFAPNSPTMSLKSSLEYKYRPTVKYEVELYSGNDASLGALSVIFRTQSSALIDAMTKFFRLIKHIEDASLDTPRSYSLYDGRFVRSIALPQGRDCTAEELAQALSDYISLFDKLMKDYICGGLSAAQVQLAYQNDLKKRTILL